MIYETLEQLLNEFFVDIHEENVVFSLGDLFDASHFQIRDVFLKTNIINSLHLPFEFAAGYIGNVKVEGLVGAVAGSPLTLSISDVCLVLRRKDVDWENELLFRYTKELMIALLQSFSSPSYAKKQAARDVGKRAFISPVKWISLCGCCQQSRFQAAIADMTIKFDRIHVRLETELEEMPIAYGVYIPTIQVVSRDVEEQLLSRRQQRGIRYPQTSEDTRSKLVTFENGSVYCDLHAERYYDPGTCTTKEDPQHGATKPVLPTKKEILERFREEARKPFAPDPRGDLLYASEIWIKLDLDRKRDATNDLHASPSNTRRGLQIVAMDIVTEALKLNLDFTQLSALNEEITRLSEFQKHTQVCEWRPSCVDREKLAPPSVHISKSALMPLPLDDRSVLAFPLEKQRKTKKWFREMWQFATLCILVNKRKGNHRLVRFSAQMSEKSIPNEEDRSRKYIDFYTRNLTSDALQSILYGKKLLWTPKSPQKPTDQQEPLPLIPSFAPLTREEQWELSDLIVRLPVHEQRNYRSMAEATLRSSKLKNITSSSPTRSAFSLQIPSSPAGSPRAAISPDMPPDSPLQSQRSPPASPSKTNTRLPDFPADYIAHHHHITRSFTESSLQPKKQQSAAAAPPLSQRHLPSSSSALLPTKSKQSESEVSPPKRLQPAPSPLSKHVWLQQVFIPPWILKRNIPFLNWSFGSISLCIFCDNSSRLSSSPPSKPASGEKNTSTPPTSPLKADTLDDESRCRDEFMKIGFERCSGSVLICSAPSPSFLLELRLGLFHATLYSPSHQQTINCNTCNNSISSDYIKDPEDGFLYLGLRYNCSDGVIPSEQQGDLKGKVCVGPIKIDYNEMTFKKRTSPDRASQFRLTQGLDLASSTYMSIIHDVYRSCRDLLRRFRKPKQNAGSHHEEKLADPLANAAMRMLDEEHRKAAKKARIEKLLNAILLHASAFEVDLGGLELHVSLLTSHVEQILQTSDPQALATGYEDLYAELPQAHFGLHSKPLLDECRVNAAGAQVRFRTTKRGRTAAIEYILRRLTGQVKER